MKIDKRTRGQKNKDRHRKQVERNNLYRPKYEYCSTCGQKGARWCEGCQMYSCFACSDYGTCMCS